MYDFYKPVRISERVIEIPNIKITYPKVSGLQDKKIQIKINTKILAEVLKLVFEQGYPTEEKKTVDVSYKIKLNKKGILSILFIYFSYVEHAAHPMTVYGSITLDIRTGKVYNLGDLFLPGSNYIDIINEHIKREIKEKDIPLIAEFETITPDEGYYLTDDALFIYFQLYEYTPYVYGLLEFSIPYGSLEEVIDPRGPLGRY